MIITDGLSEIEYKSTRVVIGKFDGIHLGHRRLIREITGKKDGTKALVFTFTGESERFLKNSGRILSREERYRIFESLGVDCLVEYELNSETMRQEPEDFARLVLRDRLHCKELVCGPDLSFGYKGRGNVELLKSMEEELGIRVTVIEKVKYKGRDISSTRIRNALKNGKLAEAKEMLEGKNP
ncbi:MAG: FAD synthetase family protein [Lachnospiraceae bacterium]|nr:FAD synthetase family protein [Lachnospiraceae bacterium]